MENATRANMGSREQAKDFLRDGVGAPTTNTIAAQRVLDERGRRWESARLAAGAELTAVETDAILRTPSEWGMRFSIISESDVQYMAAEIAEVIYEGLRRIWEACVKPVASVIWETLQRADGGWEAATSWFQDVDVIEIDHAEPAAQARAIVDARLAIVECAVRVWLRNRQGGTA